MSWGWAEEQSASWPWQTRKEYFFTQFFSRETRKIMSFNKSMALPLLCDEILLMSSTCDSWTTKTTTRTKPFPFQDHPALPLPPLPLLVPRASAAEGYKGVWGGGLGGKAGARAGERNFVLDRILNWITFLYKIGRAFPQRHRDLKL